MTTHHDSWQSVCICTIKLSSKKTVYIQFRYNCFNCRTGPDIVTANIVLSFDSGFFALNTGLMRLQVFTVD